MLIQNPLPESVASFSVPSQSLAELEAFVEADPSLPVAKKRELRSAIKSVARYLDRPPSALPADGRSLRPLIAALHHAPLGVSKKRLDNVISGVKAALRLVSAAYPGARRRGQLLSPAWQALRDRLPENSKFVFHLSRPIRFFSRQHLEPEVIDDTAFGRFRDEELEEFSLRKDTRPALRDAMRWWNKAVEEIPGWPQRKVAVPSYRQAPQTIPLGEFPAAFRSDLEACKAFLGATDPFSKRKRPQPYAPATVETWGRYLHVAASALVKCGHARIEAVTSIRELVRPAAAEALLRFEFERAGSKATKQTHQLAKVLKIIAETYVGITGDELADLKDNIKCLDPREDGLAERVRERLIQFNEPRNKLLLLEAPQKLVEQAKARGPGSKRGDIDLMIASAIAILPYAPVRIHNLATIDTRRHLRWPTGRNQAGHLHFPAHEVKNKVDLHYELPPEVMETIDLYIEKARGRWLKPTDTRLFPHAGMRGGERYFGSLITARLKRVTGLNINAQLFRHITAKLYLDRHPGEYEVVRLLLGHKSIRTTIKYYCGLERDAAMRKYDGVILGLHDELRADPRTLGRLRLPARKKEA